MDTVDIARSLTDILPAIRARREEIELVATARARPPRLPAVRLGELSSRAAIYTRSSLQRYARDAEAVTHHFTVAPYTWEDAGRVLLGRDAMVGVF